MWVIEAIIVGLIVGWIARVVVPGKHPHGLIVTAIVGIAGSVIATVGGKAAGIYHSGQSAGFLASTVGAVVLLLCLQAVSGRGVARR
jgi:uncharacterized membrane protein YeaQ/YmgE (transglycosylase-associated protein family)